MDVSETDIQQAQLLLKAGTASFVDVRDPNSFRAEHIPGAIHLDDSNVQQFVASADKQAAVVVYCYHGNSSLGARDFGSPEPTRRLRGPTLTVAADTEPEPRRSGGSTSRQGPCAKPGAVAPSMDESAEPSTSPSGAQGIGSR